MNVMSRLTYAESCATRNNHEVCMRHRLAVTTVLVCAALGLSASASSAQFPRRGGTGSGHRFRSRLLGRLRSTGIRAA